MLVYVLIQWFNTFLQYLWNTLASYSQDTVYGQVVTKLAFLAIQANVPHRVQTFLLTQGVMQWFNVFVQYFSFYGTP